MYHTSTYTYIYIYLCIYISTCMYIYIYIHISIYVSYTIYMYHISCTTHHTYSHMTVSTEIEPPPKSSRSSQTKIVVSRGTNSKKKKLVQFVFVPEILFCCFCWIGGGVQLQWKLSYNTSYEYVEEYIICLRIYHMPSILSRIY